MSTGANYFKIGAFTLAALALLVAALIAWGAGAFAGDEVIAETYINETVQGIDVGTPVKYRGVQVGNVESIDFTYNVYERQKPMKDRRSYVIVHMALSPKLVAHAPASQLARVLKEMVTQGLRVRLRPQGLTGLSYIEMDYVTDLALFPELAYDWTPRHCYIPSAPGIGANIEDSIFSINRTLRRIEQADFAKLTANVDALIREVHQVVENARVDTLFKDTAALIEEVRESNRRLTELLGKPELAATVDDASAAAGAIRRATEGSEQDVARLVAELRATAEEVRAAIAQFPEAVGRLSRAAHRLDLILTDGQRGIEETLDNLQAVSENLRDVTESARRYPSSVLFGEPPRPTEPTP